MSEPTGEPKKSESRRKPYTMWRPVDRVALVLAASLGVLVNLILVVTLVQIVDHSTPELQLSENATQIMIAAIGGTTGLLGAYVGLNRDKRSRDDHTDDDDKA